MTLLEYRIFHTVTQQGSFARAAQILHLMGPLSANGRTIAIWLAALAGNPMLFWGWEIIGLTLLALAAARALRQSERRAALSA